MRSFRVTVVAVGFVGAFALGCSSSTPAGTTGGTTGATGGGTTTGGTGGLSPGMACTANGQCQSDVCGINGVGNCCSTPCSTSDATCGATACDSSGVCTYPTGTTCGAATCSAGMISGNTCNATGTCAVGGAMACPGNLACADATSCRTSCTVATDCASGFWCSSGACVQDLADGSVCTANDSCNSGVCGIGGSGNCCTAACNATDLTCGATACDSTGACTYPTTTTTCGTTTCTGSMLTASNCDGTGTCAEGTPVACPNNFACADASSCKTTCLTASDCASGAWCSAGACLPVLTPGTACSANDSCSSGACGVNGTGNCCSAACSVTDPVCGATACDTTGACTYPVATTSCGPSTCASGQLTSSACNGSGVCISNGGVACPNNLGCNQAGTACNTSCAVNSDCAPTNFCDTATTACCASIASGKSLSIDNKNGVDTTACCGYGIAADCQTLTRAMQIVTATNNLIPHTLITLNATVNGRGGDWTTETYPVTLDFGVTLSAPGVYFNDTSGAAEIFDVTLAQGEVPGKQVTIGAPTVNPNDQVVIGSDSSGDLTTDPIAINVESNQTLNVLNAQVFEESMGTGVGVQPHATLTIDQLNKNTGAFDLALGGALPNGTAISGPSGYGIACSGTVSDQGAFSSGLHSIVAQGQYASIYAEQNCTVNLAASPQFGTASAGGFSGAMSGDGGCITYPPPDDFGVWADGDSAKVTLSGGLFSCFTGSALKVTWSSNSGNAPTLSVGNSTIENCSGAGVFANAGTVVVKSGTITHNFVGVAMETDGNGNNPSVTLNDGSMSNNTTVICSSNQENGSTDPGIDVFNASAGNVAADYVNWDQWYTPNGTTTATTDLFWCDDTFTCTCEVLDGTSSAACVNMGTDDYDLVLGTVSGSPTGTETSTNGAQAMGGCN